MVFGGKLKIYYASRAIFIINNIIIIVLTIAYYAQFCVDYRVYELMLPNFFKWALNEGQHKYVTCIVKTPK